MVLGRRAGWRLDVKVRIIAAILAVASGVACGGGGATGGRAQVGARLSASSLTFGSQLLSTSGAMQTVTVTSTGVIDLSFSAVTFTGSNPGDFSKTADTCSGAAILPNATCTVNIAFAPTGTGSRTATLNFSDNAPGSPQSVSLSGTGTGPTVGFSATGLTLASEPVGTTSPAQTETVTNTGNGNLVISAVAVAGANASDFTKGADTCSGATVATSGSCTVNVTFTPSASGSRTATLTFTDNASINSQVVTLSGTGETAAVGLSSPSLSFVPQVRLTSSASQTETVTNTGDLNLIISTVTLAGTNAADFAKSTDTCTGATVAPNTTCKVSVTFTPSLAGIRTATLSFSDSAPDSPQLVNLTGTGLGPAVNLSSPSLTFGYVTLNLPSNPQTVTITNTGTANLSISTATVGGNECRRLCQERRHLHGGHGSAQHRLFGWHNVYAFRGGNPQCHSYFRRQRF